MAIDPTSTLATLAAIIALGFFGYVMFERTRITDVLLLMAFGILVGPVLGVFDVAGFQSASALVGTLALIVIMFDGGLGFSIRDLMGSLGRAAALAVVGFGLTVAGVAALAHAWIGLPWLQAVLLGTILGGTSGIIVMPIVARARVNSRTRVLLSVESALTDVLCVIGAFTVMGLLTSSGGQALGAGDVQGAAQTLASKFSIAIVIGLLGGLVWLRALHALQRRSYSYMLTLAAILMLYVGAEVAGGNGAIAVLVFGVVLGNGRAIAQRLELQGVQFSESQRQFQGEVTFLVRVFFFVYLGVIMDPRVLLNPAFLAGAGAIVVAIVAARVLASTVAWGDRAVRRDWTLIALLLPRGLAATVLAGLPAAAGIPGTESFLAYAFIVVALTNVIGTLAVLWHERRAMASGESPAAAGAPV